jgi:hypothetical protein
MRLSKMPIVYFYIIYKNEQLNIIIFDSINGFGYINIQI